MAEDAKRMLEDNEIAKENQQLREQYEALVKEIAEKSELMDQQIEEKDKTSGSIETELNQKIQTQEEEIKKQIVIYQEQCAIKQQEEKELVNVHSEYKKKHDEFAKAMKKSKDTFKVYEGEIKNMNARISDLQKEKKKIMTAING